MMIKRYATLGIEIYSDPFGKTSVFLYEKKRPGLSWLFSKAGFA